MNVHRSLSQHLKRETKTVTFNGTSGLGLLGADVAIFTVTGEVLVAALVPFCTVSLEENAVPGGATLNLGTGSGFGGSPTLFCAATTVLNIDANEFWQSATPAANGEALPSALKDIAVGEDIVAQPATSDITAGAIRFDVYYMKLSPDGKVVPS